MGGSGHNAVGGKGARIPRFIVDRVSSHVHFVRKGGASTSASAIAPALVVMGVRLSPLPTVCERTSAPRSCR